MKRHVQTNTDPGNCWQTAIACILDIDPASMPGQAELEFADPKRSYSNILNTYLRKHHGLFYSELHEYQWPGLQVAAPGWHVLCGPTVRTPTNGRQHCIVGHYGEPIWDPHPSGAGLVKVERWGILAPALPRDDWQKRMAEKRDQWAIDLAFCTCSACPPQPEAKPEAEAAA